MRRYLLIIVGIALIAVAATLLEEQQGLPSQPSEDSRGELPDPHLSAGTPVQSKLVSEPDQETAKEAEIPPQEINREREQFQERLFTLVEVDYLWEGIRRFIDNHDIKALHAEQKVALGKSLQTCASIPLRNEDKNAETRSELSVAGVDVSHIESMCDEVTDAEIYSSYDLLISAAKTGDFYAIHTLATAMPPEFLAESVYGRFELTQEESETLLKKYSETVNELIDTAIREGSVRAASDMALRYQTGFGQPQDDIKALAYFKAVERVMGTEKLQITVDSISENLFFFEIEQADLLTEEIVNTWKQVDNLVY